MIPLYESSTFCAFAVNQSNLGKCLSTHTVVKYSISVLDRLQKASSSFAKAYILSRIQS